MNTRQFRGIRNNPSRHCEARQAPQQRTLFRGTGNRGHVADGLNHKRAMASTMFNRQKCTSGCLETCPFAAPQQRTLFRGQATGTADAQPACFDVTAETDGNSLVHGCRGKNPSGRVTLGAGCALPFGTVRPGGTSTEHTFEGRGDWRDVADRVNTAAPWLRP
ncbi:hypothetical protein Lal_00048031 [Lupinus albus]|nr:hypothetical protein Lal_00048031 [Lupinus albus]